MKLLYRIYLDNSLYKARIVEGEKATQKYLTYLEEYGKKELNKFLYLKVKSDTNYLEFSFRNRNGNFIKHIYELYEV